MYTTIDLDDPLTIRTRKFVDLLLEEFEAGKEDGVGETSANNRYTKSCGKRPTISGLCVRIALGPSTYHDIVRGGSSQSLVFPRVLPSFWPYNSFDIVSWPCR